MKQAMWLIAGLCVAGAGVILFYSGRKPDVKELAHRLEDAWADNHTAA